MSADLDAPTVPLLAWVGAGAALAGGAAAVVGAPPALCVVLGLVAALSILAAARRASGPSASVGAMRLRDRMDRTTDLADLAATLDDELVGTARVDWCVLTPLIDQNLPEFEPSLDRNVHRALSSVTDTGGAPTQVPAAGEDMWVLPCGLSTGLVLIVGRAKPLTSAEVRTLADTAVLAGYAHTQQVAHERLAGHRDASQFEQLIRFSSDAIFIVDASGEIRYAAPSVTQVLGHLLKDVEGHRLADFIDEVQWADLRTFLARVERQDPRHTTSIELGITRADGSRIEGELTGANLLANADVRGIVVSVRDVTARKSLEEQLRHQAFHDALTGLANRALFHDRLDRAIRVRRAPDDHAPAVAFLDLDDFKHVNDTLGHAAGDELLVAISERIVQCLRGSDTAARLGGDEFALLIEEVPAEDSLNELVQRVVDAVSAPITLSGGKTIEVRVSAGLATSGPGVQSSDDLLRHADIAMYRAKLRGKAQVARYQPDMANAVSDRVTLTAELDTAVRNGDVEVHYQPIVDLQTERVVAVEALARWPHPTRGLLTPESFIDVAEETGLIVPLGAHVLRDGVRAMADWHRRGLDHLYLSVNLSPRQLHDEHLESTIFSLLAEFRLPPTALMLEVTEAAFARERTRGSVDVPARMRSLVERGVRIAVDDFGIGQSSLQSMQELPFHQLKIHRAFVSPLRVESESALAGTIIELARSIGADAVAEGVEELHELQALRALGCTLGQGRLFGPPSPAHAIHSMVMAEPGRRHIRSVPRYDLDDAPDDRSTSVDGGDVRDAGEDIDDVG